tara:strand:+ start:25 stop:1149 length:1125 start_codon:yes stop_codon:yes gene_type:complete
MKFDLKKDFNNTPFTVGIEEEYMICNPDSGDLINKADKIMANLNSDTKDRFSYELIQSEIESNTSVCNTINESIDELLGLRNYLKDLGEKYNYRIGISGTHPTALPINQRFIDNDSYNWVKDNLRYYASRNITFSNHFHIAVSNLEEAVRITNSLRRWTAPLLALSANSPFFEGINTGFKSSRTMNFGNFPRTHIPPKLTSPDEFINLISILKKSKSIAKDRHIWWKIRPHTDFGTIEFRMCDAQRDIGRVKMLAAICQALVYQSSLDLKNGILKEDYNYELLLDSLWKACRFGLDAEISNFSNNEIISIRNSVLDMINYIKDALIYFNNSDVIETVEDVLSDGTEHDFQINYLQKHSMDDLKMYLMDSVDYKL